jgi:hypothetical protein
MVPSPEGSDGRALRNGATLRLSENRVNWIPDGSLRGLLPGGLVHGLLWGTQQRPFISVWLGASQFSRHQEDTPDSTVVRRSPHSPSGAVSSFPGSIHRRRRDTTGAARTNRLATASSMTIVTRHPHDTVIPGFFDWNAAVNRLRTLSSRNTTHYRLSYWMTSSATASTDGGIVRPSAFAVLRLMTRSNLVGCSTGRSAGLAPFRILSK